MITLFAQNLKTKCTIRQKKLKHFDCALAQTAMTVVSWSSDGVQNTAYLNPGQMAVGLPDVPVALK